ncbi:MAG: TldD/PmbA family protein [Treponema sp.]|nr:TldD/PmbA family protein [Treponema sp.]MCL2272081.1 TldD/PmbA family protein [Treponema sp.]
MLSDLLSTHKKTFSDYTELRAQVNTSRHVSFLAGNMVGNGQSSESGVSARVYKGGTYGFASGAEYTSDSVKSILSAAAENAAFMDKHVNKKLPPLPGAKGGNFQPKIKPENDLPQSVLIDYAKTLDNIVIEKYKNLTSRTIAINCLDIEKLLSVSDGADSHSYQPRSMIYVFMTAETDDGIPVELFKPFTRLGHFNDHFSDPASLTEELDKLHEMLMHKREGVFSSAGMRKCVMHPDLAGMLAHEAVGHTVEADLVLGGSVAGHNLGKQVASELVTMVDFAHTALGKPCPLPVYVDDEGTIAEDAVLIENGILKSFMHSKESAQHFGVKPQGNARAFKFSDEPLIRMRNTAILPGKSKLEDMIASIDDGYYLVKTGNGQADTTGEFMFSVDLGYEIKNGKLGKPIRETTISGVAFEMLKTVDMISDDMHWDASGFCGKKQLMTVGMGGPAIRCDVNIGGR